MLGCPCMFVPLAVSMVGHRATVVKGEVVAVPASKSPHDSPNQATMLQRLGQNVNLAGASLFFHIAWVGDAGWSCTGYSIPGSEGSSLAHYSSPCQCWPYPILKASLLPTLAARAGPLPAPPRHQRPAPGGLGGAARSRLPGCHLRQGQHADGALRAGAAAQRGGVAGALPQPLWRRRRAVQQLRGTGPV